MRHCLVMNDESIPGLRRLTDTIHAEGAAASAQLGHAGLVANVRSNRTPSLAPTTRFSKTAGGRVKGATLEQLEAVKADYVRAARVAIEAGFDAIELHLGHNYLLSSFFSPNLNKRTDRYGGSVEARSRFPREVVTAVREAVGDRLAILAKFNMSDGVEGGLWLDQSLPIAELLQNDGALDALVLTGGSSLLNGMYFFRGDVPLQEMVDSQPKLVGLGLRLVAKSLFPSYPFEEASSCLSPASSGSASRCRSCCSAGSTGATPCSARSTRASRSCRWAGRSCASPTCCSRCSRRAARRGSACTATSACRRSTRVRAAFWSRLPAALTRLWKADRCMSWVPATMRRMNPTSPADPSELAARLLRDARWMVGLSQAEMAIATLSKLLAGCGNRLSCSLVPEPGLEDYPCACRSEQPPDRRIGVIRRRVVRVSPRADVRIWNGFLHAFACGFAKTHQREATSACL